MASGMQTFSGAGVLEVDTSTRMGRILGSRWTGTSNGSIVIPMFSQGVPFYHIATPTGNPYQHAVPSVSGNTLSWTFGVSSGRQTGFLVYGVW